MNTDIFENKASGAFFIIPKALLGSPDYSGLSVFACMLYGLMLDRTKLSEKNGWKDEDGRTYIYFTLDEIESVLGISYNKARSVVAELVSKDLLARRRQGLGHPVKYYVKECADLNEQDNRWYSESVSGHARKACQDTHEKYVNNTDNNNTYFNNLFYESVEDEIRDNIDYDFLLSTESKSDIDNLVDIIADTLKTQSGTIRIGSDLYPAGTVKERLKSIDSEHISYVIDKLQNNKSSIRDIKAYALKLLFNAPVTYDLYISALYAEHHKK